MTCRASPSLSVPEATRRGHRGHLGRGDRQVGQVGAGLVGPPGQLAEPPLAGVGRRRAGGHGLGHQIERARRCAARPCPGRTGPIRAAAGHRRAAGSSGSAARICSTQSRGRGDRHQVRLGEVAVVLRLFLAPARGRDAARPPGSAGSPGRPGSPASSTAACRSISYRTARSTERSELTFLVSVRVPHRPSPAGPATCSRRSAASLPPSGRRTRRGRAAGPAVRSRRRGPPPGPARRCPATGLVTISTSGMPGPVVVDQRVVRAVDPAGGAADVQRLAGVLLQVHPLDLDPERSRLATGPGRPG